MKGSEWEWAARECENASTKERFGGGRDEVVLGWAMCVSLVVPQSKSKSSRIRIRMWTKARETKREATRAAQDQFDTHPLLYLKAYLKN